MIASSWTNSHMIGLSLILQRRAKLLKSALSCNSCRSELELISFVKRQLAPSKWHSRWRRLFWPRKEESCRRQHWVVYEWLFQMMMKGGTITPLPWRLHTLSQTSWSAGRLAELSPLCYLNLLLTIQTHFLHSISSFSAFGISWQLCAVAIQ